MYKMFSPDDKAFKIFLGKLLPPCWCTFEAQNFCDLLSFALHKGLWIKVKRYNCQNVQIIFTLLQRKVDWDARYFLHVSFSNFPLKLRVSNVFLSPASRLTSLLIWPLKPCSHYIKEQFMAFKILQAYNQLIFGCYRVFTDL